MKYIKQVNIELQQINLVLNNKIKIDNIYILKINLSISKIEKDLYSVKYFNNSITVKKIDFDDIVLKINNSYLYFDYFQNVLKKPFEDCRGIISDELINSAISSIESDYTLALRYNQLTGKHFKPEIEKTFLKILEKNLLHLKSEFLDEDIGGDINNAYEIANSYVYEFIRYFKKRSPEFEKILLNFSNRNGGLQITGIPYNTGIDDGTDKHYRTILDEAIYNYTITNRDGTWPEIGINTREDLLKLRTQIVDHDTLQFRLKGYGELDY